MEIHFVTHGAHHKGGNTAKTYDGPLTDEGRAAASKIDISIGDYDAVFVGQMQRHRGTCEAMGCGHIAIEASEIGNDEKMFAVHNGDDSIIPELFNFLERLAEQGYEKVLLITSRGYPMLFQYIRLGGHEKFGSSQHFCNVLEALHMAGEKISLMQQCAIMEFEF